MSRSVSWRGASRATWLRAVAVAVITTSVALAAACSDEDTVDTIPPPWPARTTTPDGPAGPPRPTGTTSTTTPVSPTTTSTTSSTTTGPPVLSTAP